MPSKLDQLQQSLNDAFKVKPKEDEYEKETERKAKEEALKRLKADSDFKPKTANDTMNRWVDFLEKRK